MATKPGPFYEFPWHRMGNYKYTLFAPLVIGHLPQWITAPIGMAHLEGSDTQAFFDLILLVTLNRYIALWLIQAASRSDTISGKTRIQEQDFGYEQVDQEDDWDNVIIMNCLTFCVMYLALPASWLPQRMAGAVELETAEGLGLGLSAFPVFDWRGYALAFLIQVGPVEFIYYWFHRALHSNYLWKSYHSHHHSAFVTEAISGNSHPLFENFCYMVLFSSTLLIPWTLGYLSLSLFFVYTTCFDLTNAMGHCNFEFFPAIFNKAPLKYLIYTPSFHSIHHSRVHYNFCLFMPYMDYLFGTVHEVTDATYEAAAAGRPIGNPRATSVPDAVFFIHGGLSANMLQVPFMSRSWNSKPMKANLFTLSLSLVIDFLVITPMRWLNLQDWCETVRIAHSTVCKGQANQVRAAKWGFFRPARDYVTKNVKQRAQIATAIERAVVKASEQGVKVCGLGALNKAHWINHGGADILAKHPNIRTRIVHGNTMTAAAVLASVPRGTTDVVLTGCTSKVGRVLAMKLALNGCTVQMVTMSQERFLAIVHDLAEVDVAASRRLVQQTELSSMSCRQTPVWIIGKWLPSPEQRNIPKGAVVLNYCFPPPPIHRTDLTHVACASLRFDPKIVTGVHSTTADLERGTWYACNVGTVVHALEGWQHHEVGGIDFEKVDICWAAAQKYGFRLSEETITMLNERNQPDEAAPKIRDSFSTGLIQIGHVEAPPLILDGGSSSSSVMLSTDVLPVWTMAQMRSAMKQGRTELLAIDNYVIDVRHFADKHPGGASLLKKFYGKDATDAFSGGVYDHSRAARKIMRHHRIAKLEVLPSGSV
jgi:sterol desaturase/sphingolipid hydroxylase (fatty acid hydroxylase superfamily)